jgi:hypothetical protein
MTMMAGYVFISYSGHDAAYVQDLAEHLRQSGVAVWTGAGESWVPTIREKIDGCDAVIAVMTPEAADSDRVIREIRYAELVRKPLVPLLLRGQPFAQLPDRRYADVTGGGMPGPDVVELLAGIAARATPLEAGDPSLAATRVRGMAVSAVVAILGVLGAAAGVRSGQKVLWVIGLIALVPAGFWIVFSASRLRR